MEREVRIDAEAAQLDTAWRDGARWSGIERTYAAADVIRLRGSVVPEQTIARLGAERLWELLQRDELMRAMIEAGAAGVHYEDQLGSEKKCGHLGGKVLVPTTQFVRTLNAARLAADVLGVPTVLFARTDALAAALLTSDIDEYDRDFVTGERTAEGFFRVRDGIDAAISRALAYAPYADVLWCETSTPDIGEAREFAQA